MLFSYLLYYQKTRKFESMSDINFSQILSFYTVIESNLCEWNNLDKSIRNSVSFTSFKKNVLKFMQPTANSTFNYPNPKITRLNPRLRHLHGTFKRSFLTHSTSNLQLME